MTSLACIIAMSVTGCATSDLTVPALNPDSDAASLNYQPGQIVWRDLLTSDAKASQAFYGSLLGWTFQSNGSGYITIFNDGQPIGGIVELGEHLLRSKSNAYWLHSVSVASVDQAIEQIQAHGGRVLSPAAEQPRRGRMAIVADAQGAAFAMVHSQTGDPPYDADPAINDWIWQEVTGPDRTASADFYVKALGYQLSTMDVAGRAYPVLIAENRQQLGVSTSPFTSTPAMWLPFVRVSDPVAIAELAQALGGRVILKPDAQLRNAGLAVIQDPTGAVVVLQKWPIESKEVTP